MEPIQNIVAIMFVFFIFAIFLRNITIGLSLLIFSIPLSPEITGVFGSKIPIRVDDILIIMLFFAWIMKIGRGETHLHKTPLTMPIIIFFTFMVISTIIGYVFKYTIADPKYSVLVLVKNFEYFAIFFLVANNVHTKKQVQNILKLWMIAYLIVVIYGIAEHILSPGCRIYEYGYYDQQSNHMGGYLMISTTIAIALLLRVKNMKLKLACLTLTILSLYPFICNQSKESYLSFSMSLFVVFLILKPRLFFLPIAMVLMLFVGVTYFFPHSQPTQALNITRQDSFKLSIDEEIPSSADVRRRSILRSFQEVHKNPIIGCGTGWRGLAWYDSQIPLLLFENGIIGTGIFLWMIFRILINGCRVFVASRDLYFQAITAGFIAAFFGILVQSIPSPAWMITLIIGPFWFLAGIVAVIYSINWEEAPRIAERAVK